MIGISVGKTEILTTTNREDKIKVTSVCPAKFQKGTGVVVKIRQIYVHVQKNVSCKQQTCSKILNVIN